MCSGNKGSRFSSASLGGSRIYGGIFFEDFFSSLKFFVDITDVKSDPIAPFGNYRPPPEGVKFSP